MKLKINKASDLNSISVFPPQARRNNGVPYAPGTQTSQLRSQASQQSMSQGFSSQHGTLSQISQTSLDEALINDQRSQERENPVKKTFCLPPTSHTREESQMHISRSSTNLMRKWGSTSLSENRCQTSEELEHRIGLMETSLNRFGMILDSVQSDVIQVNKGTKEVLMETVGIRQKLVVQENSLQLMSKEQEDMKASLDGGFKSIFEQVNKHTYQDKFQEILSVLSALPEKLEASPEKLEASIQKSRTELHNSFTKDIQASACSLRIPKRKDQVPSILPPKVNSSYSAPEEKPQPITEYVISGSFPSVFQEIKNPFTDFSSAVPPKVCVQATVVPKIETGGWKSVKSGKSASTHKASNKVPNQKGVSSIQKEIGRECRVIIESDEEIDGVFSCLLKENKPDLGNYLIDEVEEETKRILRKARRRKRQCCNTIIIN
ncbi:protein PAIR1 [Morus notabilis]|uniref:protein PAIR1 n=1 Tax=Morus notabilis TaxID=981085 RepID=UPI000CED5EF2|nr:protein PAIR1 [Morus notabilis]